MARLNNRKVVLTKERRPPTTISDRQSATNRSTLLQLLRKKPTAKVCVIRSVGGIGDVLMTLPAVKALKKEFPDADITYATDRHTTGSDVYYQLVKNVNFIDHVIDARYVDRSRFDGVVDISSVCIRHENSGLPTMNRIDIFAKACGINHLRDPLPYYKIESNERQFANEFLKSNDLENTKLIMLHTASFDAKRTWNIRRQMEFLQMVTDKRPDIKVLLSDFNKVIPNKKNFNSVDVSHLSIRNLTALMDRCVLFIGPDSGPMHLAGAIEKKSLVLFGSIPPQARINHYKTHQAIICEPKLPCLGCWYKPCSLSFKCMIDITAQQVFDRMIGSI